MGKFVKFLLIRLHSYKKLAPNLQKRLDKFARMRYNRRGQHFASIFDFALWRRDLPNLKYFDQTCKKDLTCHRKRTIIGATSKKYIIVVLLLWRRALDNENLNENDGRNANDSHFGAVKKIFGEKSKKVLTNLPGPGAS